MITDKEVNPMNNRNYTHRRFYRRLSVAMLLASVAAASTSAAGAARLTLETLDRVEFPAKGANGVAIEELSGLSWDEDEQLLYAVSDGGVLHHFRIRLDGNRIAELQSVFSVPLATTTDKASGKPVTNAEGITTINDDNGKPSDSELLIVFEDGPLAARFSPKGELIADVPLPRPLADETLYSKKNSRLEAVTFDATHGMVTAPESALKGQPEGLHTLYAADGTTWSFDAFKTDSRLKAIQKFPDGNLLILERTRDEKGAPPTARLRYLDLAGCTPQATCKITDLSATPPDMLVDNFEGMARLSDDLFLIVTDKTKKHGDSTSLVLFRVADGAK